MKTMKQAGITREQIVDFIIADIQKEFDLNKTHIIGNGYGYDIYSENENEICRCCTGMTKQAQLFFVLDVLQGICEQGQANELLEALKVMKLDKAVSE